MDKQIKEKWVAALRSGKYEQGMSYLRDKNNRFCCLGVLCDIKDANAWQKKYEWFCIEDRYFALPPVSVREWAGFKKPGFPCTVPEIPCVTIDGNLHSLNDHNDKGRTFAQIADAIEEQL